MLSNCMRRPTKGDTEGRSLVEREIGQTKPFPSSAVLPLITLLRTANVVERRYNALLEPHGITLQQFNVLSILRGAEPHGHPTLEIGARLIAVSPGVTRLVEKLERKGLVSRSPGADRRQTICRITAAGLWLLAQVDGPLLEADDEMMAPLGEAERALLVTLLDRIRAPLAPAPEPEPEELSA